MLEPDGPIENISCEPVTQGEVRMVNGIPQQVLKVSDCGKGWRRVLTSAEPLAKERGYITRDESAGFKIEHFAPEYVPKGNPRPPAKLQEADWDFYDLLKRPLAEKAAALFHELARESARLRETCRIYEDGREEAEEWETKRSQADRRWIEALEDSARISRDLKSLKAARGCSALIRGVSESELHQIQQMEAELKHAREEAGAANHESSYIAVISANGRNRQGWNSADKFLRRLISRLPYGFRGLLPEWIAKDTAWLAIPKDERDGLLKAMKEPMPKKARQRGLKVGDVPPNLPSWPFDEAIQFPSEWNENGLPQYIYGNGIPGLPCLARKGNGQDADRVLTESLELCVCLNYRDDYILAAMQEWLNRKRASLPKDLEEFSISKKRPHVILKASLVDAALKGLSALRLRAAMPPKEAADMFHRIYFPAQNHRVADIGNVQKAANIAVEWQEMFFKYCPLDAAGPVNPEKGHWDIECSLCFTVRRCTKEPPPMSQKCIPLRCQVCDHRENVGWDGDKWVPVDE